MSVITRSAGVGFAALLAVSCVGGESEVGNSPSSETLPDVTVPEADLDLGLSDCSEAGTDLEGGPRVAYTCDVGGDIRVSFSPFRVFGSAEESLSALFAGDLSQEEIEAGFDSTFRRSPIDFATRREGGRLLISFTEDVLDIPNLSASMASSVFLSQVYLTAVSDPTVTSVSVGIGGDSARFCEFLQMDPSPCLDLQFSSDSSG